MAVGTHTVDYGDLRQLAGLLEGEAWFGYTAHPRVKAPKIDIQTTDKDVMQWVAKLWGVKVQGPHWASLSTKPKWRAAISGKVGLSWMIAVFPFMGARRRAQIENALSRWERR